ncbi:hypothetical protein KCV01_g9259, partial [Aureobasidium melanogenum]
MRKQSSSRTDGDPSPTVAGIPCVDSLPVLVLRTDVSGSAIFVNRAWSALTGRSCAELLGLGWLDVVSPADRRPIPFQEPDTLPSPVHLHVRHVDGGRRCHAFTWSPVYDATGTVVGYDGVGMDVSATESDGAPEPQGPSAELLERLPAMIWSTRPDGHLDYANSRWLEHTGFRFDDAAGWNWKAAVHPDDLDGLVAYWSGLIVTEQDGEYEYRLHHPDKGFRWVVSRATAFRDADGKVLRWYGVRFDIEDRHRAEDALRTSEAYLSQAQRLSHTGSFGLHLPSGTTYWSDETYRICGYDRSVEPSLERFLDAAHPDDRRRLRDVLLVAAPSDGIGFEYRLVRPDGTVRQVRLVAHVIATPEGTEYVGAIIDETESRKAASDLEAARSHLTHASRIATMGQLAASIAHEVMQPLSGILINCSSAMQWLRSQPVDVDKARAAIERIIACSEWATSVVNNLHTYARRDSPAQVAVDLNVVIEEAIRFVRNQLNRSEVGLGLDLDLGLPDVMADRIQIQQLVINIVNNAIQAMATTPPERRHIDISTRREGEGAIVLDIADSGPGIGDTDPDHLFTPFFTTKSDGMGMGLAICRTIMDHHNGGISVSNNALHGVTFRLEFPTAHPL